MADKNFKVKSGLNIPITSAAILTTDSSGNISSTNVLPISAGGTGQTSATNAINALLPVQNGGTVNYAIQSDGSNVNWGKLYNQTIKNNGTTVNPRGIVNVVGATFTDDSNTDTTTITFTDTTGVSTSGGSTITTSSASTKGLVIQGAASQTAHLQEWQNSTGTVIARIASTGQLVAQSIVANSFAITSSGIMHVGEVSYTAQANIKSMLASTVGLIVKGAASQTANLQEWQNSAGTVLAKVDSTGAMFTTTATAGTNTTQVATTEFVKTEIDNLIASAPGTLDTLDEIAQALNDDPNFYTTITTLTNALAEQDSYTLMGVF